MAQYFPGFMYFFSAQAFFFTSSTELLTPQAHTPECQNHGETHTSKTFLLPLQDGAAAHIWRPPALIGNSILSTIESLLEEKFRITTTKSLTHKQGTSTEVPCFLVCQLTNRYQITTTCLLTCKSGYFS
jgi:hypothetical protein